jgi:hypothetical protein
MSLRLIRSALAILLLAPSLATASNFTVTPTEIDLATSATSALVTLRNSSKLPLRFEITLFTLGGGLARKMTLVPSTDVTFFPADRAAAGASRNIRVGINVPAWCATPSGRSGSLVEELPDHHAGRERGGAPTKIGIPVFVRPKPVRTAVLENVTIERGKVMAHRQQGNPHINVETIPEGHRFANAPTFAKEGAG